MDIFNAILIAIAGMAVITIAIAYSKEKLIKYLDKKTTFKKLKLSSNSGDFIDYDKYIMKPTEYAIALVLAAVIMFLIGYIFYRSIFLALILTPISLFYPKIRIKQIIKKRKRELKLQFKDALQSLSASLHAGKSFESAMKNAITDLMIQYDPEAYIIREFEVIIRRLESNETVESAFNEFAGRSKLEEIQNFAEILEICKRTGGNLITAIKSSTEIIADKIEVLNDIGSILAEKKLEQNILSIMPIAMISMLSLSASDFMLPVFTETIGRIVMTISMGLFATAYFIAEKITNIEV
jgi:tight adherence protein B